ncbi:cytochrome-c peroxidase [Shewanella gaetbuli]
MQTSMATPLSTPSLDDIEYPEGEPPTEAEVYLGKLLFFDERLSGNRQMSCATCHNPDMGFSDGLKVSLGNDDKPLSRHTPSLYNLAWGSSFFADGRASTLEHQVLMPIFSSDEMNLSKQDLLDRLNSEKLYQQHFKQVYDIATIDTQHIRQAFSAFLRSIIAINSPYDQYLKGNQFAISKEAISGLKLFTGKANCIRCHDGPNFTDDSFHSLGIATIDKGKGVIDNDASMNFRFKTPTLRNITLTAPYMHNGSIADLESVIHFYNRGGGSGPNKDSLIQPLNLSDVEIRNLLTFLATLTDPILIERPSLPELYQAKITTISGENK